MTHIENLLTTSEIHIISGEGGIGRRLRYTGRRTLRSVKMRVALERHGGARWARAEIYSHTNDYGPVGIDVLTGEPAIWSDAP